MKAATESSVLSACLAYLRLRRIVHWRANTGAMSAGSGAGRRFIRFGPKGQPDVFVVVPTHGRLLAIECKSERGRLRPEHSVFLRNLQAAGALAVVVRDVAELVAFLGGQKALSWPAGKRGVVEAAPGRSGQEIVAQRGSCATGGPCR
jgi:hypothetical protein